MKTVQFYVDTGHISHSTNKFISKN